MPTIGEMISFHRIESQIYQRILSLGTPNLIARNIVALWIFLQYIGIDLIYYIGDCRNDALIRRYIAEARSVIDCIRADVPPVEARVAIPLTTSLVTEQINLRFFYFQRDVVGRGMSYIMDGIGTIIFESGMNLDMSRPYHSRAVPDPIDRLSLFITFDSDRLRREDILEYFQRKWDDFVHYILIEEAARGVVPIYGRIVLKSNYMVDTIFRNNEQLLTMEINGDTMMVRKFTIN